MNYVATPQQPFLALVDDDEHSARLMTKVLEAHHAPKVHWFEGDAAGDIGLLLANPYAQLPELLVVDLKTSSRSTAEFIAGIRKLERADRLLIAAMSPTLDWDVRDRLIDAGADAVFQRHADLTIYRREVASMISFWVRNQRLNAIGT